MPGGHALRITDDEGIALFELPTGRYTVEGMADHGPTITVVDVQVEAGRQVRIELSFEAWSQSQIVTSLGATHRADPANGSERIAL